MTTRLVHVVIDANDPARLGEFWAGALGWQILPVDPDEIVVAPAGFDSIYPDPVALPLVLVPVPERKTVQNRLHLDLATTSAQHQAAEVERLLGLGAVPADVGQGDVPWTVLADPEGNELCVLDPRPEYADTGPVAAVVATPPRDTREFRAERCSWGKMLWKSVRRTIGVAAGRSGAPQGR